MTPPRRADAPAPRPRFGDASPLSPKWTWWFHHDQEMDLKVEPALLVKEVVIVLVIIGLVLLRGMFL